MDKLLTQIVAISCCAGLSACATGYHGMGITGGVNAKPQADGSWLVKASGNGFTSQNTINNYLKLKAAETAQEQGMSCIAVISFDSGAVDEAVCGGYGCSGSVSKPMGSLSFRAAEMVDGKCEYQSVEEWITEVSPLVYEK